MMVGINQFQIASNYDDHVDVVDVSNNELYFNIRWMTIFKGLNLGTLGNKAGQFSQTCQVRKSLKIKNCESVLKSICSQYRNQWSDIRDQRTDNLTGVKYILLHVFIYTMV